VPSVEEFDLSQLPGWGSLPAEAREKFAGAHLPSAFLDRAEDSANFVVGPDLGPVEVPSMGRLIRFGRRLGGLGGDFCMNPTTGVVALVIPGIPPMFVNSGIDLMARTIHLALDFQRQFTTGDAEECWSAAEDFRDSLQLIDPPASHPDTYWGTFASDAEAGNYSNNPDF